MKGAEDEMTIGQAIARIDELKPNAASAEDKVRWLAELDGQLTEEVWLRHHLTEDEEERYLAPSAYTADFPGAELKVAEPYTEIYIAWLEAKIDYFNGETRRYTNSLEMYNGYYDSYVNHFRRTHMPKGYRLNYWHKGSAVSC